MKLFWVILALGLLGGGVFYIVSEENRNWVAD